MQVVSLRLAAPTKRAICIAVEHMIAWYDGPEGTCVICSYGTTITVEETVADINHALGLEAQVDGYAD